MSLTADVYSYLVAQGQGTALSEGWLPDSPDTAVALYPYAGRPPESVHTRAGISAERQGLQVVVRGASYAAARTRMEAIDALLRLVNTTLGSTVYQQIWPMASWYFRERDLNGRTVLGANYLTRRDA